MKKAAQSLDPTEANKLGNQADKAIFQEVMIDPLFLTPLLVAQNAKLMNYGASTFGTTDWTMVGGPSKSVASSTHNANIR